MSPKSIGDDPVDFTAPRGLRVRLLTLLPIVLVMAASGFNVWFAQIRRMPPQAFWWMALAPAVGLLVALPVIVLSMVRGYRIADTELQIMRLFRIDRFSLPGLESVEVDRRALESASKIRGNDGAGAILGVFNSPRLGRLRVFVTDPELAVVLRWPDRCLVVSPGRPEVFAQTVRARAGLRR